VISTMAIDASQGRKIPGQFLQRFRPVGVLADFVVEGALNLDADDRPLGTAGVGREVPSSAVLSHPGLIREPAARAQRRHLVPAQAYRAGTRIRARRCLALSRARLVCDTGSYAFEPPGETHTLVVPAGDGHALSRHRRIHLRSRTAPGRCRDVFTKLAAPRAHYEAVGLGTSYADKLVR
jgi:2,4'-dihydroxyacetophenone dioxygenase